MRAAASRAQCGTTLRIERCFASAPVRYAWLTRTDAFEQQFGEARARIECFLAARPSVALALACGAGGVQLRVAAHDSIERRVAHLYPALLLLQAPAARDLDRGGTAVRVERVFAAEALSHHSTTAVQQIVYWNGVPLSGAHHEAIFAAIDGLLARQRAPQGRSGARRHASFAVFLASAAPPEIVLARQVEAITNLPVAPHAVRDALRAALGAETAASASNAVALGSIRVGGPAQSDAFPARAQQQTPATSATTTMRTPTATPGAPLQRPRQSVQAMFASWRNPMLQRTVEPTPIAASAPGGCACACASASVTAVSLDRARMHEWRFVAQCDRKYILLWWPEERLVLAGDQHAIDERINLERLEQRVFGDVDAVAARCRPLPSPIEWRLTGAQARTLLDSADAQSAVRRWGFRFTWQRNAAEAVLLVWQVPAIESTPLDLAAMLDIATCGAHARPAAVERILHAKACRGAIMFGDSLSAAECEALVAAWRATKRPFVCAHERPSVVPLHRFVV
jgi:DNA mismatch repair ATPase MutL